MMALNSNKINPNPWASVARRSYSKNCILYSSVKVPVSPSLLLLLSNKCSLGLGLSHCFNSTWKKQESQPGLDSKTPFQKYEQINIILIDSLRRKSKNES